MALFVFYIDEYGFDLKASFCGVVIDSIKSFFHQALYIPPVFSFPSMATAIFGLFFLCPLLIRNKDSLLIHIKDSH